MEKLPSVKGVGTINPPTNKTYPNIFDLWFLDGVGGGQGHMLPQSDKKQIFSTPPEIGFPRWHY